MSYFFATSFGLLTLINPVGLNAPTAKFETRLVTRGESLPIRTFPICLDRSGELFDVCGHEINDKELKALLRPDDHATLRNPPSYVLIFFEEPSATSLTTLKKTLDKLCQFADANRSTTIYVKGLIPAP